MPPARQQHAACCIAGVNAGDPPLLMVVGGCDTDEQTFFSDVWLLDLTNGSWSEVRIIHK